MPVITKTIFMSGKMQSVSVNVTGDLAYSDVDEKLIVETTIGLTPLHQTSKATGNTAGGIGYIHNYAENQLWLVGAVSASAKTITILRGGKVNGGVHKFK